MDIFRPPNGQEAKRGKEENPHSSLEQYPAAYT